MNLCIDQGNSSIKMGIFDQSKLVKTFVYKNFDRKSVLSMLRNYFVDRCIYSSVINKNASAVAFLKKNIAQVLLLTHETPLPIENKYQTPKTLGKDRLAAVVGAGFLEPNRDVLVIDAGTAITFDFMDAKRNYWGGNIDVGLELRLKALHTFAKKLPLVKPVQEVPLMASNTEMALAAGALNGIIFEIDGYINALKIEYPDLSTFLTGGSLIFFDKKLKNSIFVEKNLVLIGLNYILQYNVQ